MKLTKEQAYEIAEDAYQNAGYHITQYVGYYTIFSDDEDDWDYAVAINKEADDNGDDQHFAVYVSPSVEDGWWVYTSTLDINELTETLLSIVEEVQEWEDTCKQHS